ncbi:ATP-grasp fold amidoligase family protein [Salegentibacter sp. F14]
MKFYYEYYTGNKLNLDNPRDFNEKIQWLKVYYHPPILSTLVDKYAVREYVEEKLGPGYLNELYGVYNSEKEVDFDKLPNRFVLKAAHGYNFNLIVRSKKALNVFKTRLTLKKWMSRNQYYRGGKEWAYKHAPARIIAERYLEEIDQQTASDYKFFCFNGQPKYVAVMAEIKGVVYRCNYDLNWNKLPFYRDKVPYFKGEIKRPENFDQMIEVATKLADKFPFVRVDLYDINGKILFGELTFYPADGRWPYLPAHYNKIIGDYMKLPDIPEGQNEITKI